MMALIVLGCILYAIELFYCRSFYFGHIFSPELAQVRYDEYIDGLSSLFTFSKNYTTLKSVDQLCSNFM